MVLNNNIINVFNNYIIAINAVIEFFIYLIGNKAILTIQYKNTRFKSICTKSQETSLPN